MALSFIKQGITGIGTGVGAVRIEADFTDGVTGQRVAAVVDERAGTKALRTKFDGTWGDFKLAMDWWATRLNARLDLLKKGNFSDKSHCKTPDGETRGPALPRRPATSPAMKRLLIVTAAIEVGAGLVLLCCPSAAMALLLGTPLDAAAALTVARVGGAALLALGVACWFARGDAQSRAARGLVAAMVVYNFAAVALFVFAGIGLGLHGVALWPAVVLHTIMTAWCMACLLKNPLRETK